MANEPYYEADGVTVYQGDCLDVMQGMQDNLVDTIVTDPPYGLSFMGKGWDHGIPGIPYWREALRVAKPGATLMAFGGTRTYHRLTSAIEDAGWEIRDCVSYFNDGSQAMQAFLGSLDEEQLAAYLELHHGAKTMAWVYGGGFPKSHNVSKGIDSRAGMVREVVGRYQRPDNSKPRDGCKTPKFNGMYNGGVPGGDANDGFTTAPSTPLAQEFNGYGTGLKPAFEPIVVAMKPMGGTFAENAEKWGVSGYWIDGGRIETNGESLARPFGNAGIWNQLRNIPNGTITGEGSKGRWPANTILDNSDEVEAEFAKAGVRTSGGFPVKRNTGFFDTQHKTTYTGRVGHSDSGSASRYFQHCPPDTQPARLHYCPKAPQSERRTLGNNHPTQKPLSLLKYLCRLTRTPTGGIVLDPFAGSGTTGLAAIAEGRQTVLIEQDAGYCDIITNRLQNIPESPEPKAAKDVPRPLQMNLF